MAEKLDEYSYPLGGYVLLSKFQAGVIGGIGEPAGWNEIAAHTSGLKDAIDAGLPIDTSMLAAGLSIRSADGTSTTPAIAWGNPTWSQGLYRVASGTLGLTGMDFVPATEGADLGKSGNRWDIFGRGLDVSSVASFAGAVNIYGTTTFNSVVFMQDYLNVGTANQAASTGDLSCGLSGANYRMFYKQSTGILSILDNGGTVGVSLSPDSQSTFNGAGGSTADLRVIGANKTNCVLADVSADEFSVDGRWSTRVLTASNLVGSSNNNYTPESVLANRSTFWRIQAPSIATITGILGGLDGRQIFITNYGTVNISLANANASSDASARITTGTGGDVVLAPDDNAMLMYDHVASVWRQFI